MTPARQQANRMLVLGLGLAAVSGTYGVYKLTRPDGTFCDLPLGLVIAGLALAAIGLQRRLGA